MLSRLRVVVLSAFKIAAYRIVSQSPCTSRKLPQKKLLYRKCQCLKVPSCVIHKK